MRETYLPRTPGLVADRAWVGTPCETWTGAPLTPCGKPSTCRYPAMGGGWHHMCAAHGARHANIIEHADGRQGKILREIEGSQRAMVARRSDQKWRAILLATPTREADAQTVREIAPAIGREHTLVGPVLSLAAQWGTVERGRSGRNPREWSYWRVATDEDIANARSLPALGRALRAAAGLKVRGRR